MTKSFAEWCEKQDTITRDQYETQLATLQAKRDCALATYHDPATMCGDAFLAWQEYQAAHRAANRLFFQGLRLGYVRIN